MASLSASLTAKPAPGRSASSSILLNPAHRIRERWRRPHLTGLIADDELVVLDPDGALLQMMSQRQGATYRQRPGQVGPIGLG